MKIRRSLPDIDLARITALPPGQQRPILEKMKLSFAPFTYNPTRSRILDSLNAQVNPLLPLPRTPWQAIESYIRQKCGGNPDGLKANIGVSKALYEYAVENNITGLKHDFLDLPIGSADKVKYWSSLVINIGGHPTVPFIEPRRTKGLTSESRRFVFSVMHERIRVLEPDLSTARLVIFQFGNSKNHERVTRPHFDHGIELLDFNEILRMTAQTYAIWEDVLAEREADTKRRSTGTSGPLI